MPQVLTKVRRVSTVLLALCWASILAIPALEIFVWTSPDFLIQLDYLEGMVFTPENLTPVHLAGGFVISMISQSVLLYGLWRLQALFCAYRRGELFEARTTSHLKTFSICILLYLILQPFTEAALTALVTSGNPEGERMVAISVSSDDIHIMLLGGLLLVVAWVLNEGAKAVRENRMIV